MRLMGGPARPRAWIGPVALAAASLAACGWFAARMARRAEQANPPRGKFVTVDGVRLHYTEHGKATDPPLVILHGMGSTALEVEMSGLVGLAAVDHRVIVFDRPGYGHSTRPRGRSYTPQAQAQLFASALGALGIRRPVVLAHSWATLVARAMAQDHAGDLRAVVLVAGYYTPSLRLDTAILGSPAIPLLGTLMRHTISPWLGRILWPLFVRRVFAPAATNPAFAQNYPVWLNLRPGQLRASALESAMLPLQAARLRARERPLGVPAVLVAGDKDRLLMTNWQSRRLHERLPGTRLNIVPGAGHMVHHTAPAAVMEAVRQAEALADGTRP